MTIIIITIAFFSLVIFSFWKLGTASIEFHKEADILEKLVRTEYNQDEQLRKLFHLREKSFHKNMGIRIREIAKMMEVKYDIKVLI